jgi:hypothetical protein
MLGSFLKIFLFILVRLKLDNGNGPFTRRLTCVFFMELTGWGISSRPSDCVGESYYSITQPDTPLIQTYLTSGNPDITDAFCRDNILTNSVHTVPDLHSLMTFKNYYQILKYSVPVYCN